MEKNHSKAILFLLLFSVVALSFIYLAHAKPSSQKIELQTDFRINLKTAERLFHFDEMKNR